MSRSKAFTIVELLVSLAIIGMITGAMLANFRGGQLNSELRFAADLTVGRLRQAQTDALAGRLIGVCVGGGNPNKVCEPGSGVDCTVGGGSCQKRVVAGYGILFSTATPKSYAVFYDVNGNGLDDGPGEEVPGQSYVSTDTVKFTGATQVASPVDVVFTPPSGQLRIKGLSSPDLVTLTFQHAVTGAVRHVNLYRISGKIEHD